jgi:hypothetical protein
MSIQQLINLQSFRAMPDGVVLEGSPYEYRFCPYSLPGTCQKGEAEEVLARLLVACRQAGDWMAISHEGLLDAIRHEWDAVSAEISKRDLAIAGNRLLKAEFSRELEMYVVKMHVWLHTKPRKRKGTEKPTPPYVKDPELVIMPDVPDTHYFISGARFVSDGLHRLAELGYVASFDVGGTEFLHLTPSALVAIERFKIPRPVLA